MFMQDIQKKYPKKGNKRLFLEIILIMGLIGISLIINIFFNAQSSIDYSDYTINFIKFFNYLLSILAYMTCIISYNRIKNETIFIISLMYLGLSTSIFLQQVDYLPFYNEDLNMSTYMPISPSIIRMCMVIISILPNSKIRLLIVNNKIKSIAFIIINTIIFGILETKLMNANFYYSRNLYIYYNLFLSITYIICSLKLFFTGLKRKENIFVLLSSSIFILALKAAYAIYYLSNTSYNTKLISVAITYMCFFTVIIGALIELNFYTFKIKKLNTDLNRFYNLTNNNKHSFMFICNENIDILYANKRIKEYYLGENSSDLNKVGEILKNSINLLDKKSEIVSCLKKHGVWRGIIKSTTNERTIDCWVELISQDNQEKEFSVTYIDISDEISIELELEKLKIYDKEKNEFISNISHELKTPLNLFYSIVQLLDNYIDKDDSTFKSMYEKYNKTLHINYKRMLRLINNTMDLSKIDIGMLDVNFKNYDVVSIVENVTLSVVEYASLKSINVQFDTNVEEHIIKCDSEMIERAILNLLSNAIKFSNEYSTIYVNVYINDKWVQIDVKDEGIGICEKNQEIIFEKFVQIDKSFTRNNEGSGIGLSIVKSIVNLHDGNVYVNSSLNKGSIFTILLPNEYLEDVELQNYDIEKVNTELELSDIYEVLT